MARERYLVGVDPEELKPDPPKPPQKPAKWWENLWYHYKWNIIVGIFALVLVITGVAQLVKKDDPDFVVVMLTGAPTTAQTNAALQEQLEAVAADRDGDGKIEVLIEDLAMGIAYSDRKVANDNTLLAHLAAGDVLLWAMEPEYYESKIQNLAKDYDFFTTLSDGSDHVVWQPGVDGAPDTLWIGVRNATGTADGNDSHAAAVALVEGLLKQK
ncbi:MAG: hypothetical protein ACOYJY_00500 [Acutalibacteraceae bacterium]|jgi:hypothetical protein